MPFTSLFDPMYWLIVGPTMALAAFASWRVKSTFREFQDTVVRSNMTGAEAAQAVCQAGGAQVTIEQVGGFLSDHYDPRSRTLRLSPDVYNGRSISAVAVGAHEAGHALQHASSYPWLGIRSKLVPVTQIGSRMWIWVFMAGMMMNIPQLVGVGILLLGATVLFQLVTLPVEFDASSRAKAVLAETGITSTEEEKKGVSKVLGAAAMTYVAGALTALATLAYYVMRYMQQQGRR